VIDTVNLVHSPDRIQHASPAMIGDAARIILARFRFGANPPRGFGFLARPLPGIADRSKNLGKAFPTVACARIVRRAWE
jgi:hypothetical protein